MTEPTPALSTTCLHGGVVPDPTTGAILTPIYQTTTYRQAGVGENKGHTYTRCSNPTVSALEAALGALEGTPPALAFSTGMAATAALMFALVRAGDHVVCGDVVYGGTVRLLSKLLCDYGVEASFVDATDPAAIAAAIRPETRVVFVESPANPTMVLTDIAAVAAVCQASPHRPKLVVDNTFLTAVQQRCLELGADVALYSTTKYIEGHNSTVGGAVLTRDEALRERLTFVRKTLGSIQKPMDAWMTLRGLKTLPLRLRAHSEHALAVARHLAAHPQVTAVYYPGLETHPQHDLARRQQQGFGGMLAFEVVGGAEAGRELLSRVELIALAENLGAAESLITHPASMTHVDVPLDARERLGITDGLLRLSVGLEDPVDLCADLDQALAAVAPTLSAASA